MFNIHAAKLVVEIIDESTGEIITREATLGDFKEVTKKATSSRTKKPKDDDPTPKITVLEGKWQLNNAAIELTGFTPEMKLDIKFEKKGRVVTPVLCADDKNGNRLTKTYTVSCRGSKRENLVQYGTIFELTPYPDKEGFFKLKGNVEVPEDDIVDIPEEISSPDELDSVDLEDDIDMSNIDFNFD